MDLVWLSQKVPGIAMHFTFLLQRPGKMSSDVIQKKKEKIWLKLKETKITYL
jgi:hypothetical protein